MGPRSREVSRSGSVGTISGRPAGGASPGAQAFLALVRGCGGPARDQHLGRDLSRNEGAKGFVALGNAAGGFFAGTRSGRDPLVAGNRPATKPLVRRQGCQTDNHSAKEDSWPARWDGRERPVDI